MDYEKAKLRTEVDGLNQQVKELLARVAALEAPPVAEPKRALFAKK